MVRSGALLLLCSSLACALADELEPVSRAEFHGEIHEAADLRGVAFHADLLVVCSDETAEIQILTRDNASSFSVSETIPLGESDEEIDVEGVASEGDFVYVVGSHARPRKAVDPENSRKKNLERLLEVDSPQSRDIVFRVRLNEQGDAATVPESISFREYLDADDLLSLFTQVSSKENGIDIEAIGADGDDLYVGFRGPVLRGNYVPVLVLDFNDPDKIETRFVDLDGLGVRDLCAVAERILVLAGRVGDAPEGYAVYLWNGKECIPDRGDSAGNFKRLARIKGLDGGKPEGLAILNETDAAVEVLIVDDGPDGGAPVNYCIAR